MVYGGQVRVAMENSSGRGAFSESATLATTRGSPPFLYQKAKGTKIELTGILSFLVVFLMTQRMLPVPPVLSP